MENFKDWTESQLKNYISEGNRDMEVLRNEIDRHRSEITRCERDLQATGNLMRMATMALNAIPIFPPRKDFS